MWYYIGISTHMARHEGRALDPGARTAGHGAARQNTRLHSKTITRPTTETRVSIADHVLIV
jgi:hypothetical protein